MSDQSTLFPGEQPRPWQRPSFTLHRTEDPDTSRAAARALGGKAGTMRRNLLLTFVRGDWTAEEVATEAGYSAADGAWKRVSDLQNAGLIEDSGMTATGSSGREQRVMRITPAGIAALAERGRA